MRFSFLRWPTGESAEGRALNVGHVITSNSPHDSPSCQRLSSWTSSVFGERIHYRTYCNCPGPASSSCPCQASYHHEALSQSIRSMTSCDELSSASPDKKTSDDHNAICPSYQTHNTFQTVCPPVCCLCSRETFPLWNCRFHSELPSYQERSVWPWLWGQCRSREASPCPWWCCAGGLHGRDRRESPCTCNTNSSYINIGTEFLIWERASCRIETDLLLGK